MSNLNMRIYKCNKSKVLNFKTFRKISGKTNYEFGKWNSCCGHFCRTQFRKLSVLQVISIKSSRAEKQKIFFWNNFLQGRRAIFTKQVCKTAHTWKYHPSVFDLATLIFLFCLTLIHHKRVKTLESLFTVYTIKKPNSHHFITPYTRYSKGFLANTL